MNAFNASAMSAVLKAGLPGSNHEFKGPPRQKREGIARTSTSIAALVQCVRGSEVRGFRSSRSAD